MTSTTSPLTSLTEQLEQTLLYRCVSETRWRKLKQEFFLQLYVDEIGDENDLALSTHVIDSSTYGPCSLFVLENGLVVLESPQGRFSLYETEARARARDHVNAWADFARGYWTLATPQESGLYFVKSLDHARQAVRELAMVRGRLKDTTKGEPLARVGLVSEWRGYWWMPKVPRLP